jgi:preprotein translocase SecE subunit
MAEKKKRRIVKPSSTMREKIEKADEPQKRKIRETVTAASTGKLRSVREFGRKEYHPVKLPDNKVGRLLTKRGRLFPRFFGDAWRELRQVTWPNRRETFKLTTAVLIFAIIFCGMVAIIDLGLEKLFRNVILK